MIRVKQQNTGSYVFTGTAIDDDGETITPVAPFTCKLYDGAGTLISTTTPTCVAGTFSQTFDHALLPLLDTYQVVWTGTVSGTVKEWTTTIELVGGFLFEIADLRARDRAFKDLTTYPSTYLRQIRTAVEEVIEGKRAAKVAFVPRGRRTVVDGTSPDLTRGYSPILYGQDYRGLRLNDFEVREVYSVKVNDLSLTQTELDAIDIDDDTLWRSSGVVWPAWAFGHRNISVHYTHGHDRPPGAITRAALILATEYLIASPLPGRATATSIGDQIFRLTIAGRDGITGLPDVDAAINDHGRKEFGIG